MTNEKYLVIEKEILEKLIQESKIERANTQSPLIYKWLSGNVHALETVKQYCKPLDETI